MYLFESTLKIECCLEGSVHSGHWVCSILTNELDQDGSEIWATINDTYPITKADSYDVRMSTLFLYKKMT